MKKLETKAIEQLLSIIPPYPATRIMHISDGGNQLYEHLLDLSYEQEYEYFLAVLDEAFYQEKKGNADPKRWHFVKKITLDQRLYASKVKQYDFLFVSAEIPEASVNAFVKKVHAHIKNSGNIILFLPKNDPAMVQRWYEHLEEHLYVAMNTIDIFEHYEILIAKKMHGWGGV